jgi:hypothetical protein
MAAAAPTFRTLQAARQYWGRPLKYLGSRRPPSTARFAQQSGGSNSNVARYSRAGQTAVSHHHGDANEVRAGLTQVSGASAASMGRWPRGRCNGTPVKGRRGTFHAGRAPAEFLFWRKVSEVSWGSG